MEQFSGKPGRGIRLALKYFLSELDKVNSGLMKSDASLIAAISGAGVEVASI